MKLQRCYFYCSITLLCFACENKTNAPAPAKTGQVMPAVQTENNTSKEPQGELVIEDLKPGQGEEVKQNQTLRVKYKAFFASGALFDSTEKRGKPFTFMLGEGTVIKGWEQGIRGMKAGGIRRLTIPPHLAYGEKGISGLIPPASTLVFEVELIGVDTPISH